MDGRTRYLLLTLDNAGWLAGIEVDRSGERVMVPIGGTQADRLHLIQRSEIESGRVKVTPMMMNLTYCRLEVAR